MKLGSTILMSYSYNNAILSQTSIVIITTIHPLRYLVYEFVLRASLNIPQLQFYQIDMQDEVVYNHSNAVFV